MARFAILGVLGLVLVGCTGGGELSKGDQKELSNKLGQPVTQHGGPPGQASNGPPAGGPPPGAQPPSGAVTQ
jgi:hypothetical protein